MTPRQARVKQATADDIDVLVGLMRDFYAESRMPLDEPWATASFTALLARPAFGAVWLVLAEGQAVAYAVLAVRHMMEFGGPGGYVDDLYVRPVFRRRGVATLLLDALLAGCRQRGCHALRVETGASSAAARALYARYGLEPLTDERILLGTRLP